MFKIFIEVDKIVFDFVKTEKLDWNQLLLIGIIQFDEENFSCIISNEKILKSINLEKEIYFQIYLLAKEKFVSIESFVGDLVLNSYIYLLQYG